MAVRSRHYDLALAGAEAPQVDSAEVIRRLEAAIEEGDDRAYYALGTWYLHGKYVDEDKKRAFDLISYAAESGNEDALYDLAVFYEEGRVVKKNVHRALALYISAALHGHSQSHYEVGRLYWHGLGTAKDEAVAEVWLQRAEELGIKNGDDVDSEPTR
jgi:TPR repeat protein